MSLHKNLFWITKQGIQAYKMEGKGEFSKIRWKGEEYYPYPDDGDFCEFFKWFDGHASLASDDRIDFCFLSEVQLDEISLPEYNKVGQEHCSSWDKKEILLFFEKCVKHGNYKIQIDGENFLTCQLGNISDPSDVGQIYLTCIPEFSYEAPEVIDNGSEETSVLYRHFRKWLDEH